MNFRVSATPWIAVCALLLCGRPCFAQISNGSTRWEVFSSSNAGDGTGLRPVIDDWDFGPFRFYCEGSPPSFQVFVIGPEGFEAWGADFETALEGALRIATRPTRKANWTIRGYWEGVTTSLHRSEIDALLDGDADLDIEVRAPAGATYRRRLEPSRSLSPALIRFLETCSRHVKQVDRQFQIDGIQIALRIDVDERGIEDIRALAAELGIREVEKIYVGLYGIPSSSLAAIVTSRVARDGDHILQSELLLRHEHWSSSWVDPDDDLVSRGGWQTSRQYLFDLDRWILRDGDWSIEARLGSGVSYRAALQILRAVRLGTLVDAREGPRWIHLELPGPIALEKSGAPIPRNTLDGDPGDEPAHYEVNLPRSLGSGTILRVRIVGEQVEVLSVGSWIV